MLWQLLFSEPRAFVLIIFALILCISIHEFAHAYVAFKLGDPTAKALGRVTLDPRAHIDPLGMLLLIIVGFGWGRPVPYDPSYLRHPKRDSAIIALVGPLSNFILAGLLALFFHVFGQQVTGWVAIFGYFVVLYNLVLGVFNLIPVYPLDGYKIVAGVLPNNLQAWWSDLRKYGTLILLALILTGLTEVILSPILAFLLKFLGF